MDGLRRWINEAYSRRIINGYNMSMYISLTHIMFVYNILFIGEAFISQSMVFLHILNSFGEALILLMNKEKKN